MRLPRRRRARRAFAHSSRRRRSRTGTVAAPLDTAATSRRLDSRVNVESFVAFGPCDHQWTSPQRSSPTVRSSSFTAASTGWSERRCRGLKCRVADPRAEALGDHRRRAHSSESAAHIDEIPRVIAAFQPYGSAHRRYRLAPQPPGITASTPVLKAKWIASESAVVATCSRATRSTSTSGSGSRPGGRGPTTPSQPSFTSAATTPPTARRALRAAPTDRFSRVRPAPDCACRRHAGANTDTRASRRSPRRAAPSAPA